jgi:hypothetical protein
MAGHDDLVDLAGKLQIKAGSRVAVVAAGPDAPDLPGLGEAVTDPVAADAVIAFARCSADLAGPASAAIDAGRQDKLAWIAYPKAGQLGTDLNRDILVGALTARGVRGVRLVAVDDVWSALRLRPA